MASCAENILNNIVQNDMSHTSVDGSERVLKKRGRKPKTKDNNLESVNESIETDNIVGNIVGNVGSNLVNEGENLGNDVEGVGNGNVNFGVDVGIDSNGDGSMKTKRRGRKPKDKFKFDNSVIDELQKNSKREENVIVKLPLTCLKLNEEFNVGKDLFPYNPTLSVPKPCNPEDLRLYSA